MPTFTPPVRALDPRPLFIALRTALLANSGVTAIVGSNPARVYRDADVTNTAVALAYPLVIIGMPSGVPEYDYANSRLNALFDITAVDTASSTTNSDALAYAIQSAILDATWTIAGYSIVHKAAESVRPYTDVVNAITHRYTATTFRIIAEAQ